MGLFSRRGGARKNSKTMIPINIPAPPNPWDVNPFQEHDDAEACIRVAEIIRKEGQTVEEVARRIAKSAEISAASMVSLERLL